MRPSSPATAPYAAIALISAATLAYEILLTRVFAIVHWHHLVATAISLALLGYGASGTFLALAGQRLHRHFAAAFVANALLFSASALVCVAVAQRIPFDPLALSWDWRQLLYLGGLFLTLAIPFFAAANCIGLTLWRFDRQIPRLYGLDLLGAGVGVLLLIGGLSLWHPALVLYLVSGTGLLAAVLAARAQRWRPVGTLLACLLLSAIALLSPRVPVEPAPYKDLARALSTVGAEVGIRLSGVAGSVTVVRNERVPFRHAPGLSLQTASLPPTQSAVFVDGELAGGITLPGSGAVDTGYLANLTSALPYALLTSPRVLILNAGTALAVRQALHLGATAISAVEVNPQLLALHCTQGAGGAEPLCDTTRVRWHTQSARAFVAGEAPDHDLIKLMLGADISGLDALQIDFDATVEAFGVYLDSLSPQGMLAIDGPTRLPPRLAIRMLDTARQALLNLGIEEPAGHIAMIRGWQRFSMLVTRQPLHAAQQQAIREFALNKGFDLIWLPGMDAAEANRFQQLSGPLFHQGAARLFGTATGGEVPDGAYRLAAVHDDRPFSNLFTTWSALWQAIASLRSDALSRLDSGLFIGVVTLGIATVVGLLLIVLPLLRLRRPPDTVHQRGLRTRTLAYFSIIGLAFLLMEIAWIQRLQLFLGHPVYATSAVLAAFLVFAGLGSLWSQQSGPRIGLDPLSLAVLAILLFSLLYVFFLPDWLNRAAGWSIGWRILLVFVLMAPLAFSMGVPFPTGLRGLGNKSRQLIPWAWGINGCASVIGAAGAPLLASTAGFDGMILIAAAGYLALPLLHLGTAAGGAAQTTDRDQTLPDS